VLLVVLFSIFVWWIGKKINYELSYSSMVEKTVIEKVKPECLIRGVD
jgi:hypothetical protein